MDRKVLRNSIVTRLSFITGLIVIVTAAIVYVGGDFRLSSLYREQRDVRAQFFADSLSYGIHNIMAAKGSEDDVKNIAAEALRNAKEWDPSIIGLEIENEKGEKVFSFRAPQTGETAVSSLAVDVQGKSGVEGHVTVWFKRQALMENEKVQQVVMLGNTVASMAGYYLRRSDYFQVKYLAQKMLSEYPDVLYGSVTGPDGVEIYSRGMVEFSEYITDAETERAAQVSGVEPVIVQELGESDRYGRIVEVAVLVSVGEKKAGVVRIGYSMASLAKASRRTRVMLTLIVAGAAFIAFAASIFMTRGVARPLGDLAKAARTISPHNVKGETRLEEAESDIQELSQVFDRLEDRLAARGDEVSELASSFRDMIHNLDIYIKQLKTMYQKMSLSDRLHAMGQLSAGIAHEINNPLTIMSTYIQMMLKKKDLPDDIREEIGIINEEIGRISEKVRELQSFTREASFQFAETDMQALLIKILDLCRHQIGKSDIRLEIGFESEEPLYARVDSGRMRQVFLNLILNAIHALEGEETRVLRIGAGKTEDGKIRVTVEDTGAGIDGVNLDRVFDPFFTTKKPGSGTGMGLAISYNIIRSHGGDILVESERGAGARFTVIFPPDGPRTEPDGDVY